MLERREAELREAMKLRHSLTTLLHALRVDMEQVRCGTRLKIGFERCALQMSKITNKSQCAGWAFTSNSSDTLHKFKLKARTLFVAY